LAVPFPFPLEIFLIGPALFGGVVLLIWLLPRLIGRWRQARYDATVAAEQERFEIVAPGHPAKDDATPRELIRALAPQQRLGDDRGGKGWPTFELRAVWRDGELVWQFQGGRQMAVIAQHALAALYPGTEIQRVPVRDGPAVASAIGRLTAPTHRLLGTPETTGGAPLQPPGHDARRRGRRRRGPAAGGGAADRAAALARLALSRAA